MFGQRVASLALVLGAAHPLGGGWSLLRLFPDLQLGNGHAGHCREDDTSPHCNVSRSDDSNSTNGSESDWEDSWDRGENTRPDPEHSAAWLVWFLRVSWGSIWKLAENGIMWCGTLCASVSIAAKWSYWLLVAVVLVFCLQLLLWTICWVILPCMRHLIALYRYLMGRGAWHEVVNLHGVSTFRPRWYGPKGQHEWTAEYIQQQVRGRGESREPHDLLVTDGVAIARIRHGTLRGRTNRHGYRLQGADIHSASHRYYRNILEAAGLDLHLCACDPCSNQEEDVHHVLASAIIPRAMELDLQETAGKGPVGRCIMATKFWGCKCAPCTSLFKALKSLIICCCCCCKCRKKTRPAASTLESKTDPQTPRHEHSETESEAEGYEPCQADHVTHVVQGKHTPLCMGPCRDVAQGEPVRLLDSDATKSNVEELHVEDGATYFSACNHHRAIYENGANKRKCAVEGCYAEVKQATAGIRLCKLHAVKEEKPKSARTVRVPKSKAAPPSPVVVEEEDPAEEVEVVPPEVETVARSAPGPTRAKKKETERKGEGSELLGMYLKAILSGTTSQEALSLSSTPSCGPRETLTVLQGAAAEYLPKLPTGYPEEARQAIVNLLMLDTASGVEVDPVLDLVAPPMKQFSPALPSREEGYVEHPGRGEAITPKEELGWQSLYRPRGVKSFPASTPAPTGANPFRAAPSVAPPQAQQAFAQAARPRHLGAFTDAEPPGLDETSKALQAIAKTLTNKDEAAGQERGKLASIGKVEERVVFLLRGCDSLTVCICQATVGKELYQALKATSTQGRPQLRAVQFPVNINNRIAFGLASLSLGGRDVKALPDYALSAADFPLTSEEEFDGFAGTPDNKLEKRPKPPLTLSQWYRNALRQSWAVSCVMGTEHYGTLEAAATYLLRLGEDHGYIWPPNTIFSVWEEVWARFSEEMRELDRSLRRAMKEESPSFERIRFFATAPGPDGEPWLQLPRTFFLEDEGEYFQTEVVPRHNRMLSRACWQVALKKNGPLTGQRAGGEEDQADLGTEASVTRPDPKVGKGNAKAEQSKLLGPQLSGREGARSLDHRPKERKSGKYLCWDHATHRGCKGTGCPHSHAALPKWDSLDWSVQMQLLRRGGLKGRPQISAEQATQQIEAIRARVKEKTAENVQEGKRAKAGANTKSGSGKDKGEVEGDEGRVGKSVEEDDGWQPPRELLDFAPTDMESQLASWTSGKGVTFYEDADQGHAVRETPAPEDLDLPAEAQERLQVMKEVDKTHLADGISNALGVYLRNRLMHLKIQDPNKALGPSDVHVVLEDARRVGPPEIAAEADSLLSTRSWPKVGFRSDGAYLTPFEWREGIGYGYLKYGTDEWEVFDYGDRLPITESLRQLLEGSENRKGQSEIRQCLLLHCTAGCLGAAGATPSLSEVHEATSKVRLETAHQALGALHHLGEMPEEMGRSEADVRVFIHDSICFDHDKDYRSIAAFPPHLYEEYRFHIVRLDPQGTLTTEEIIGTRWTRKKNYDVWLLVHQGHMRLLRPPTGTRRPPTIREVAAVGWDVHLEAAEGPEARVRARDLPVCPRCEDETQAKRRIGNENRPIPVFGLYPLPLLWDKYGAPPQAVEKKELPANTTFTDEEVVQWLGPQASQFQRALKEGLDFLEVYAGSARASQAVQALGGVAIFLGIDHGQDFSRARDRALGRYLLDRLKPRHLWLAFPCPAFCAWMRLAELRDYDIQPRLAEGRHHLGYSFGLARAQREEGRHAHAENPLTSRAWKEAAAVRELSNPEWKRARLDQCTTGLTGPQGDLHLKPTMIRTTDPAMQDQLHRLCPGTHTHELVQGQATARSAMYSPHLAMLIARVVMQDKPEGGGAGTGCLWNRQRKKSWRIRGQRMVPVFAGREGRS